MRAIWKGAVAFGLVNVPVKLYAATAEHEITLHQVHAVDGGRIRYQKVCTVCGEVVEWSQIAKAHETADGELVVLTAGDLDQLPLATERAIEVLEFVPVDQVDPVLLGKTYFLEPEKSAAKPYALLRGALAAAERVAVVKVALRQRESMAVLRVRDDVICLQTLLWPDEVRTADFPVLAEPVQVRPQELAMASSLIDSLAADFDPTQYSDGYAAALAQVIEAKVSAGQVQSPPVAVDAQGGGEVVDLLAALQRSVDAARAAHGQAQAPAATPARAPRRPPAAGKVSGAPAPAGTRSRRPAAAPDEPAVEPAVPARRARRKAS